MASHETIDTLGNPLWRLAHLYSCREEGTGKPIAFKPRDEQKDVFRRLTEEPDQPLYIIKSRRLGISTAIDTFLADQAVFSRGFRGMIIDQNQEDATKKMVEIVRFAVDSLPREILERYRFDKRNDGELRLRRLTEKESQDSVIYATTSGRGGDCSMLHVSEWGPISATDPERSNEIRTGAFPAARRGRRVVETTWYGGKSGDLWDLVKPILESNPNAEGVILFFPWHNDPHAVRYSGQVTNDLEEYFRGLAEKLGKSFSSEQKLWYAAKRLEQGLFVRREYPSILEEAIAVPMAGAIYGDRMDELREGRRVAEFSAETGLPAYTFWDVGMSDYGAVWLLQFSGRDILALDYYSSTGEEPAHYVKVVQEWERKYCIKILDNFMPHDADHRAIQTKKTYRDLAMEAGLASVTIVPRTPDEWIGINELRTLLPRFYLHSVACNRSFEVGERTIPSGIMCLDYYHKREDTSSGIISERPVHDQYSHGASALRTFAEAYRQGLLPGTSMVAKETRHFTPRVLTGRGVYGGRGNWAPGRARVIV